MHFIHADSCIYHFTFPMILHLTSTPSLPYFLTLRLHGVLGKLSKMDVPLHLEVSTIKTSFAYYFFFAAFLHLIDFAMSHLLFRFFPSLYSKMENLLQELKISHGKFRCLVVFRLPWLAILRLLALTFNAKKPFQTFANETLQLQLRIDCRANKENRSNSNIQC